MVILTESSPTFFFQIYDLPSDPILLILVSSDHKTPFQSPNIQFSWYLQKKLGALACGHFEKISVRTTIFITLWKLFVWMNSWLFEVWQDQEKYFW